MIQTKLLNSSPNQIFDFYISLNLDKYGNNIIIIIIFSIFLYLISLFKRFFEQQKSLIYFSNDEKGDQQEQSSIIFKTVQNDTSLRIKQEKNIDFHEIRRGMTQVEPLYIICGYLALMNNSIFGDHFFLNTLSLSRSKFKYLTQQNHDNIFSILRLKSAQTIALNLLTCLNSEDHELIKTKKN